MVHKHIVRYLGTEVRESTLYIFTEWVSGGSLEKMLEQFPKLPEKVVAKYTQQASLFVYALCTLDTLGGRECTMPVQW